MYLIVWYPNQSWRKKRSIQYQESKTGDLEKNAQPDCKGQHVHLVTLVIKKEYSWILKVVQLKNTFSKWWFFSLPLLFYYTLCFHTCSTFFTIWEVSSFAIAMHNKWINANLLTRGSGSTISCSQWPFTTAKESWAKSCKPPANAFLKFPIWYSLVHFTEKNRTVARIWQIAGRGPKCPKGQELYESYHSYLTDTSLSTSIKNFFISSDLWMTRHGIRD